MKYSFFSSHSYYMSWDEDTVPCKHFSMFDEITKKPYFDLKYEFHEEYFITLSKLFPQMKKSINKSHISEHMIFKTEIMKRMILGIEANPSIKGCTFYEKILYVIRPEAIDSNSFSEFETYGTYVSYMFPETYLNRNWHSIRYGSIYFIPNHLSDEDYKWIGKDFDAISFEKNQEFKYMVDHMSTPIKKPSNYDGHILAI